MWICTALPYPFICWWTSRFLSHKVMSNSLRPYQLQHTRLPCSSLSPRFYSNSYPWIRWCHPMISSFIAPFSCPQCFPASWSFPVSQFFASFGQSVRASTSASDLPMNIQGWFPLGLTGLTSLLSKGLPRVFSSKIKKHHFYSAQPSLWSNSHICTWLMENP